MNKVKGFTLIELMVVVTIVAILLGVALPSYQAHVLKTKRNIAEGAMLEIMGAQEQFFVNNRQYTTSLANIGWSSNPGYIDGEGEEVAAAGASYEISLVSATTRAYTVQAVPKGAQAKDTGCGTLKITSVGVKTVSGSDGVARCW
jgi:type IV pilus assembly protein PilE